MGITHLKFKFNCVSLVFIGSSYYPVYGRLDGVKNVSFEVSEMGEM